MNDIDVIKILQLHFKWFHMFQLFYGWFSLLRDSNLMAHVSTLQPTASNSVPVKVYSECAVCLTVSTLGSLNSLFLRSTEATVRMLLLGPITISKCRSRRLQCSYTSGWQWSNPERTGEKQCQLGGPRACHQTGEWSHSWHSSSWLAMVLCKHVAPHTCSMSM